MKLKLTKDPSHKGYYQDQYGNLYVFRFGGRPIKVDGYRDDKPKEKVNRDEVTVDKEKVIDHSKTATEKDDKEYNKEIEIENKKAEDNMEPVLRYSQEFSMQSPVNDLEAAQNYLSDDDMTKYVPDELVNVVQKAEWVLDDESSGHINIETTRELGVEEQKILSDWIEGQNSDGLGEGFEQQEFAENYFDPNSGDGPYTRYEAEEEINRRIEEMDSDDYVNYLDDYDVTEATKDYLKDGYYNQSFEDYLLDKIEELGDEDPDEIKSSIENTPEESLYAQYSEEYDEWVEEEKEDFLRSSYLEDYLNDDAISEAKSKAAMDDTYYNVDEWYNMSSMRSNNKEFEISEVQNLNQDVDLESMIRHSNAEYTDNGNVMFYSKEDFKNFGQTIADKLNDKYAKNYGADFRYRINKNEYGGEYLELYDANESVESTNHIYEDLAKEVKSYFGEEGVDVWVEPYDNVSITLAGFYGEDYVDEEDSLSSMSNNEITHRIFSRYPDVSEEDEDYLNSLSHDELVKEVKNRGWNLEDEEVEEPKHAGWELYSDDPNRYGDLRSYNEKMQNWQGPQEEVEKNKKTTTEEIAEEVDKNYPELSKRVEDEYYASMKQAAKELGYNYDSNKASEFLAIIERAEEIRNKNRSLQNRYSGTISTLQELHPGWSMAKIMEKIRKLDEED